jgi:membrane-associated phospholipid phosphatase
VDNTIYLDVNNFSRHTAWLHFAMANYAKYGLSVFAILMLIGWGYSRRKSDRVMASALLAPVIAVLAFMINQPVAGLVKEQRPYNTIPNVLVLLVRGHDWSFPSDHAILGGAVTAALFYVSKRLGYVSLFFALLMAFARVYAGVHYPQDVVVGLVDGALVAVVLRFVLVSPATRTVGWARKSKVGGFLITRGEANE